MAINESLVAKRMAPSSATFAQPAGADDGKPSPMRIANARHIIAQMTQDFRLLRETDVSGRDFVPRTGGFPRRLSDAEKNASADYRERLAEQSRAGNGVGLSYDEVQEEIERNRRWLYLSEE